MNQFLDFAKASLGIKLRDFDFNHTTIELVESFLEYGKMNIIGQLRLEI